MLSPSDVIEKYNLSVFLCFDLDALSTITRRVLVWVYVYYFPVSLVPE